MSDQNRQCTDWVKKKKKAHELFKCCLQETQFRANDIHRLKVRGHLHILCK